MPRLPAGVYLRRPGYRVLSALILALIVGGIILIARLFGSAAASDNEQTPAAPAPTTITSTGPDDSVYTTESAPTAPDGATRAGDAFVRAWLQPTDGRSQKQWYAGLQRYALPDLAAQLEDVDPTTNPATNVTGESTATPLSDTAVRVTTPTNAGPATTLCVQTADGWRVATIDLGE